MNTVYSYMTETQLDALRRATDCGFVPTYECMANRIWWAHNEEIVANMAEKACADGLFGEQVFIKQQESLAQELADRIYNLEEIIASLRRQVEELNLTIDAAKMLATSMTADTIQTIAAERKNDLASAEYIYYIAICSHCDTRKAPIAAALYRVEVGNVDNIRFVKDLIEVEYEHRNTLADRLAKHPEVFAKDITHVIFYSNMDNKLSKKPFMKHFELIEYVDEICY